jgi:hypothetical protein
MKNKDLQVNYLSLEMLILIMFFYINIEYEIQFLKLIDKITNGTKTEIEDSG